MKIKCCRKAARLAKLRSIVCSVLGGATLTALSFFAPHTAALGQDVGSSASDASTEYIDEVLVTGTAIRGITPVGSESVALDFEDIKSTGLSSTADVVRTLPQLQNIGIDETRTAGSQDAGSNNSRGTALNLRGLGSNATLMLVDGRRIAPSGTLSAFGDPNQIPIAAVQRIEVITDGSSAIYGTDAVGGVVNFILRKDYDGAEVTAKYLTTDGYDQRGASIVFGQTMTRGNFIVAFDYEDRDAMLRGSSKFMRQDLRAFGGNDNRTSGTTVAALRPVVVVGQGSSYYSVPAGLSSTPTAAQLTSGATVVDTSDYNDYLPARKRESGTLFGNFDLTDNVSLYYEGFYNHRDGYSRSYSVSNITIPSTNPYYISGIPGVAPGAPLTVAYPWFKDFAHKVNNTTERSISQTLGLRADLPNEWAVDFYGTHAVAKNCQCEVGQQGGIINGTALNALLAAGDPAFNPFLAAPISDAVRARVVGQNALRNTSVLNDFAVKFDGPLFSVPAGHVRAAVGAEYTRLKGNYHNAGTSTRLDNRFVTTYIATKERKISAGFAELFVPLVGTDRDVPLVQNLNLSLAARYEDYSDFGTTTNPKVGLTWDVIDSLSLRGTWGKSFRAPSLQEVNEDVVTTYVAVPSVNQSGDPAIPISIPATSQSYVLLRAQGGNNNLGPERATTYSFGFDYRPGWAEGLTFAATYYHIEYIDRIVAPTTGEFLASPTNRARYAAYITPAAQPSTCVNGQPSTYNPVYQPAYTAPYPIPFTGVQPCQVVALLNGQYQNLGQVNQDGLDLTLDYARSTTFGLLSAGFSLTKILNLRQTQAPASPLVDVLDTINNPLSTRARARLGWNRGPLSANVFGNYTGSYTNTTPITIMGVRQSVSEVPSWFTTDVNLSYSTRDDAPAWGQDLRLSVSIQNVTDKDPPTVLVGTNAFDNQGANPYGRIWTFEMSKAF